MNRSGSWLAWTTANGSSLKLWRLYRRLHLHHLLRRLIRFAPAGVRRVIDAAKAEFEFRHRDRLVPQRQLTQFYREAIRYLVDRQDTDAPGNYLEFGVYNGTSLIAMDRALAASGRDRIRLFGFDSFDGLPPDREEHWGTGAFQSGYDATKQILIREGVAMDRVTLVKGFFAETLNEQLVQEYQLQKASVIMIDCDLYQSAKEALTFCAPLIRDEALVIFDEWFPLATQNAGEKRAFDEFLQAHPEFVTQDYPATYKPNARAFLVSRLAS